MTQPSIVERVDRLCRDLQEQLPAEFAAGAATVRERLHGPLRIAIAGRVKAGKSTLLNALIGERLAPTDAGESTRIVTWYRFNSGYSVAAQLEDGREVRPPFRRRETALEVNLDSESRVVSLEIGWPSQHLRSVTYIDTPGLGSLTPAVSSATTGFLGVDEEGPSRADAVIYLMRHAHAEDVQFLEGFRDAGLPMGSPVNTVAVLSRADEIAGGRLDAMHAAARIADRYRADPRVRALAGTVVPMAGLLAETAATLEESEYAALRLMADSAAADPHLLLSVDRFRDPDRNPLTGELRELLLSRLGLFGLRYCADVLRRGSAPTSQSLVNELLAVSGITLLRSTIAQRLTGRARPLIARSALVELRHLGRRISSELPSVAAHLDTAIEETMATTHEFAQLELLHDIATGAAEFSGPEIEEAERLASGGPAAARLGLAIDAPRTTLEVTVLAAVERWRQRVANPLANRETVRAGEVMARSYERLYADLQTNPG